MKAINWILSKIKSKSTMGLVASGPYGLLMDDLVKDDEQGVMRCALVPNSPSDKIYQLETLIYQAPGKSTVSRRVELKTNDTVTLSKDFPVDSAMGKREYMILRESLRQLAIGGVPVKSGRASVISALIWVFGLLVVASILTSPPNRAPRQQGALPPMDPQVAAILNGGGSSAVPSAPMSQPSKEELEQRPRLTEEQMGRLAAAANIPLEGSGSVYYVFSDPSCPSCRKLEQNLSKPIEGFKQVVIPVAYRSGAEDLAASVLCLAKDKQAKAWKDALEFGRSAGPVCDDGKKKVKANNALFESVGFDSTPTMVSPRRAFITGAGSFEQVSFWLKNY